MKQNASLSDLSRSTHRLLRQLSRFHYVISLSLMVLAVVFTLLSISNILSNPVTTGASQTGFSRNFDTATIQKVNQLRYSNQTSVPNPPPAPTSRNNPFSE